MGTSEYFPIAEKYKIPIVVSGFEPADLLQAIYHAVLQLEKGHKVENCYERLVKEEGNIPAQKVVNEIFEVGEQEWRGIGSIPESGLVMKEKYAEFDAARKFSIENSEKEKKIFALPEKS
jgi:hydrogenase expression/formation protein HypD